MGDNLGARWYFVGTFMNTSRLWGWDFSARFYAITYFNIAHQIDTDIFKYLDKHVEGALVADCGSGPGIVTEKFIAHGAAKVLAIDSNAEMMARLKSRLKGTDNESKLVPILDSFEGSTLRDGQKQHLDGRGFDIIYFKRSLYMPRPDALALLREAFSLLAPGGRIVVVHPELRLLKYCFAKPIGFARHTLHHLLNRFLSRISEMLGGEQYTLHTKENLLDLMSEAGPGQPAVTIESDQTAFNLAALIKPSSSA